VLEAIPDNALAAWHAASRDDEDVNARLRRCPADLGQARRSWPASALKLTRAVFRRYNARTSGIHRTRRCQRHDADTASNDDGRRAAGVHSAVGGFVASLADRLRRDPFDRPARASATLDPSIFSRIRSARTPSAGPARLHRHARPRRREPEADRFRRRGPLGEEYLPLAARSSASVGLFLKDMKDNAYRAYVFNDPGVFPNTLVRTSRNAKSAQVRGREVRLRQAFSLLPHLFDGLGVSLMDTYAGPRGGRRSRPVRAGEAAALQLQVATPSTPASSMRRAASAPASCYTAPPPLLGLSIDEDFRDYDVKPSRYLAPTTTLDVTASYRVPPEVRTTSRIQNIRNEPGRAYDGNETGLTTTKTRTGAIRN